MDPINLNDYEALARERLPKMIYDYYAGGATDELTVSENQRAWGRVRLRPRVLVDVRERDLSPTILNQPVSMPILTAPAFMNSMAHPDGELAVARATAAAGVIDIVSTMSAYSWEEVAETCPGARWFQLYCYRDRSITRMLIERAEAAGYTALCLTVDAPLLGSRERDVRNRFNLPAGMNIKNLEPLGLGQLGESGDSSALSVYIADQLDAGLNWEVLDWLRGVTSLPLLVKGILTAEDAHLAVDGGASGIIVSNHGDSQLDGVWSTYEALPEIIEAVDGRIDVLVNRGIRRGIDVLKALVIGA